MQIINEDIEKATRVFDNEEFGVVYKVSGETWHLSWRVIRTPVTNQMEIVNNSIKDYEYEDN